jgi:quinol monooxygenase YgiN
MIIRVFTARLKPGARAAFERLCREKSAPEMQAQPGFLAYHIAGGRADRPDDFVFVSVWRDTESIRAFAGEHWQEVLVIPGEADLLESAGVRHYDESYASLTAMWHARPRTLSSSVN